MPGVRSLPVQVLQREHHVGGVEARRRVAQVARRRGAQVVEELATAGQLQQHVKEPRVHEGAHQLLGTDRQCLPRHQTYSVPSFLKLIYILGRGEHYSSVHTSCVQNGCSMRFISVTSFNTCPGSQGPPNISRGFRV